MSITALIEQVHTLLGTPAEKWRVGDWNRGAWDSPERYVWVPTAGLFMAPAQASNSARAYPRNLWTHRMGFDVHIWDETLDDTVARLHGLMAALRRVTKTELNGVSDRWDRAQMNERGFLVVLGVELPLIVSDEALMGATTPGAVTTAHVTTVGCDPTPAVAPPGFVSCPCPEDP